MYFIFSALHTKAEEAIPSPSSIEQSPSSYPVSSPSPSPQSELKIIQDILNRIENKQDSNLLPKIPQIPKPPSIPKIEIPSPPPFPVRKKISFNALRIINEKALYPELVYY